VIRPPVTGEPYGTGLLLYRRWSPSPVVLGVFLAIEMMVTGGAPGEERRPMTAPRPCSRRAKALEAGRFQAEISSFGLHLAAEGKAAKTIRTYTEAVQWFAAARLLDQPGRDGWAQVGGQDVQEWMVQLLARYSSAYASNQYRDCSSSSSGSPPRRNSRTR
jgi:hypothetical protein